MSAADLPPYPDETDGDRDYLAAVGWHLDHGGWIDPATGRRFPDSAGGVERAARVERGRWFQLPAPRDRPWPTGPAAILGAVVRAVVIVAAWWVLFTLAARLWP